MVQMISADAFSAAPPAAVYELLRDPTSWSAWSSMDVTADKPGRDDVYGVGSTRKQVRGRVTGFDEVVELVNERRFGYVHLRGLPVRDYRAAVDLEPADGGTKIHWQATFRPKTPGTGWLLRISLRTFLQELTDNLATYAARKPS